jgi:hypothetical protein
MSSLREITVGADVIGTDNRAIQIAVDALASRGGGTVRVLAGQYTCYDSVHLRSNVKLIGEGDRTILRMAPTVMSPLALDADIGQFEITAENACGFRPGMGIILRDAARPNDMAYSRPMTVTRVEGSTLYTSRRVPHDFSVARDGIMVNHFPLIHGYEVEDAVVEGFMVDGETSSLDGLDDVWNAAVHLERAQRCAIRNVTAVGALGDGIRTLTTYDVAIEDCEAARNTHYGTHHGMPAVRTEMRRCSVHHNGSDGVYLCWNVREGIFEDNDIHNNGLRLHRNGVSIGHKDTDNLIARNHIYENHKHGVCFRAQTEGNGPHRNALRENIIENNGCPEDEVPEALCKHRRFEVECCGVFVRGITHDLTIERNVIRETREGSARYQRDAVYLDEGVGRVNLVDNEISRHPGDE